MTYLMARYTCSTGYDAALYSAASNYYNQKQQTVNTVANTWNKKEGNSSFNNRKPGGRGGFHFGGVIKKKTNPSPAQTHYCDVCKISCAGPQVSFTLLSHSVSQIKCSNRTLL